MSTRGFFAAGRFKLEVLLLPLTGGGGFRYGGGLVAAAVVFDLPLAPLNTLTLPAAFAGKSLNNSRNVLVKDSLGG